MCGIFAYIGKEKRAKKIVFEGLKKLEYRGYDSWGIAAKSLRKNVIILEKHIGKISETRIKELESSIAIGHTRWATHGGVTDFNAHPHIDCSRDIAVVHNGIVENYQEIKNSLVKRGHRFNSETDSEVIAHLIEEKRKIKKLEEAVFDSFKNLIGLNAILVLDRKEEKIIACRNGSPLVIGLSPSGYFFSSDTTALLKHTNKVYFLLDGDGVVANRFKIIVYDLYKGKEKKFKITTINWQEEETNKKGYKHYLIKEIWEQKKTMKQAVELNYDRVKKLSQLIKEKKYQNIVITGCGSAYHCGFLGKYFLAQVGIDCQFYPANEISSFTQFFSKKTLLIAISQSGETADTLEAVREAKKRGSYIVALVNARGSTLERLANSIIPVLAGPEIAVVSTKAFINQLIILYFLSSLFKKSKTQIKKEFDQFFSKFDRWLDKNLMNKLIDLSKNLINKKSIFIVGKGVNYPAALEFALKIKETSYLHAEAFAAGELKHGVIALIEKETPCFVLGSNDDYQKEILSSATEIKARGGKIYGVAPFNSPEFDYYIETFDGETLTVIPNIVVGQLLGYYLGILKGADPDKPRNLAKSVTVK